MLGCCSGTNLQNCGWVMACVGRADYRAGCKSKCQEDPFTLKWQDHLGEGGCASQGSVLATTVDCPRRSTSTRSYYHTYRYPDASVIDYRCGLIAHPRLRTIETTYSGQSLETYSFQFTTRTLSDIDDMYGLSSNKIDSVDPTDSTVDSPAVHVYPRAQQPAWA